MEEQNELLLSEALLKDKIYVIRGVQVMLDADLAEIYGYTTKRLNEQVNNIFHDRYIILDYNTQHQLLPGFFKAFIM